METSFWKEHAKPLFLGGIVLGALLGIRDGFILTAPHWPKLHGVVNVCTLSWEEIVCYLPFANRTSFSNLFPARPSIDPLYSRFTNFPFLTLWVETFLYKIVCFRRADWFLLFMHVVFPLASYVLLYRIYQHFLGHKKWTLFFSFAGVLMYNHFHLSTYLLNLWRSKSFSAFILGASLSPPEITRTPSPSFTFFFFVLCFYLTLNIRKPRLSPIMVVGLLWGLNLYVYLFNFVLGSAFWLFYLVYIQILEDQRIRFSNIMRTLIGPVLILLVCLLPVLLNNFLFSDAISSQVMERMNLVTRATASAFRWDYLFLYFVGPVAGALLVAKVFSFDYYELFFKFTPILIVAVVELLVLNLHFIFGKFFQPHLFSIRIGAFFFHLLYAVPILYYVNRPPKLFSHGGLSPKLVERIYWGFRVLVIEKSTFYLLPLTLLIVVHSLSASIKNYRNHESEVAPAMAEVEPSFEALRDASMPGQVIVSDVMPVNLLVPALTNRASLVSNAFNNYETTEDIIERLVLVAKIYGWDQDRFMQFMLPQPIWEGFYEDPSFRVTEAVYHNGLGYWLAHHQKSMNATELEQYRQSLETLYRSLDVHEALNKYHVAVIEAKGAIAPGIPYRRMEKRTGFSLYWVI